MLKHAMETMEEMVSKNGSTLYRQIDPNARILRKDISHGSGINDKITLIREEVIVPYGNFPLRELDYSRNIYTITEAQYRHNHPEWHLSFAPRDLALSDFYVANPTVKVMSGRNDNTFLASASLAMRRSTDFDYAEEFSIDLKFVEGMVADMLDKLKRTIK